MASILPLEFREVGFSAGGQVLLRDLSIRFEAGSPSVVMGPNGAGKSLSLRIAHGLLAPTTGSVRWLGLDAPPNDPRVRHRQAMVFEQPVLLRRSAAANVDYALAVARVPRSERADRVAQALSRTGLARVADRRARVLSAGEQQRLSLARAWALEPEVLFLDEPTAALDPGATRAVEESITAISESGTKIVMTTHDLGQARRLAGEILLLCQGRLVERAAAADFFESPESAEARSFLNGDLLWQ
ncbi:MAG: ATP-binding cassette domain-containing protein [Myxococcota bacterium]|nr:ATP-binding cassette domain-containing protein [Myxococcota bacterium]